MKAAYSPLLVGRSLRINLNKWLPIMCELRLRFHKRGGRRCWRRRTRECKTKTTVQEEGGERSRREVSRAWGWWSEVLNHLSVCQQKGGKSRSGWCDPESGDVEILNSVVQTLTVASSLFFPHISSSSSCSLLTVNDCPSSTTAVVCH